MASLPQYPYMDACIELVLAFREHARYRRTINTQIDIYCGLYGTVVRRPGLLIVSRTQQNGPVPPSNIVLVGDVSAQDQAFDTADYAQAGIEWRLDVRETADGYSAQLHQLDQAQEYQLFAKTDPGDTLRMPEPFNFALDLARLTE